MRRKRHITILPVSLIASAFLAGALLPQSIRAQDDLGPQEMYTRGIELFTGGAFAECIPLFSRLYDLFGKEPEFEKEMETVLYALGSAYYNTGQFLEAQETYAIYKERFPKTRAIDEVHFRSAAALQYQEQYEQAVATYRSLIETWPQSAFVEDASYQIAICHMAAEQPGEAVTAFEHFVETFPRSDLSPQALVFLGRAYFQSGDLIPALEAVEKSALETKSVDHLIYANFLAMEIGDAAFDETEYALALRAFRRVRNAQSLTRFQQGHIEKAEAALARAEIMRVAPSELAAHFRMERRLRASLQTQRESLKKLEESGDYDTALFHRIGRCFFSVDRFWEARTAYERVVRESQDPVLRETAHFDLILALNRLRRFDDLIASADEYLATYGKDQKLIEAERVPAVAFMRAESYINMERFEEAETEMSMLQRDYPQHNQMPRIKFYRALAITMQERFDESINLFRTWLEEYPNHTMGTEVAYWLPVSMFYNSLYEEAIPLFDQYVRDFEYSVYAPEAAYRSALSKYALEDFEAAAKGLETWLDTYPDHLFQWEARVTLGDAYAAEARHEEARDVYLSAVKPEAGPMEYLALTQLNKVFKALDTPEDYRRMADTHIRFINNSPNSPNLVESAYEAGWALRQLDRIDEARRLYWGSLERFGNDKRWDGFGLLLRDLRNMYREEPPEVLSEKLQELINKARTAQRRTLVARLTYAVLSWRDDLTAVDRARELDRRFPLEALDAELLAFMGDAYIKGGESERGRELLDLLLSDFATSKYIDVAYARKSEALLQDGDYTNALAAAEIAIQRANDSGLMMEAVFARGRALREMARYDEAIEEFNMVLSSRASPRQLKPQAMLEAAACFEALGDWNKAIPYYQRIYVMYAAYTDEVIAAYLRSAAAFEKIRDVPAAMRTYEEMLASEDLADRPEMERARAELARLEARMGS